MILYAPGSAFDEIVKQKLAAGIVIVADEEDEPALGADTRIVKTNSPACRRGVLELVNSTSCNTTENIANTS